MPIDNAIARAGQGSCTLAVSGMDEIVARVRTMGIDTSDQNDGGKVRTLMIRDPDGNHIAFAEAFDKGMAR